MTRLGLTAAALCLTCSAAATAETTWSNSGKGTGMTKASTVEVADGHLLMQISSSYDRVEMEDADHPMHGAAGHCFGAVEAKQASVSGSGVCALTDRSEDKVVLHWTAERMEKSGAMAGRMKVTGGTGKWAKAMGSGTYSSLADPASGTLETAFSVTLTLP